MLDALSQDLSPSGSEPPAVLAELLQVLVDRLDLGSSPEEVERAVRSVDRDAPPIRRFDDAAAALGVGVRWMVAPPADALPLARPDLPLVVRSEVGTWWVVDGAAALGPLRLVHAVAIADPRGARWGTARSVAIRVARCPDTSLAWGLVEPALPAAPLASPAAPASPARRLRSLLWTERRDLAVIVMYGVVAGLLSLATPLAIQVLINWLAFGALLQPVLLLGVGLLVCLAVAATLQVLQRVAVETLERRLFVRTVADLSARLARVRAAALDGLSGPELANRFFDVLTLQKAAGTLLLDGITALLQVALAVGLLAVYHPWLLVFDLFLLAGMALSVVPTGRGAQRTAILESKAKYAVAAWIEEISRHPTVLRQDGSRLAADRADALARKWLLSRRDHFRVFLRQLVAVQGLQVLMSAVLLVTSGALVLRGQLTIGQLVAAEFIVNAALIGFAKFADKLDTVYDTLAGVDKLGTLLDLPPEPSIGAAAAPSEAALVELERVTLDPARGGDASEGELTDIDLVLPPGSRTTVLAAQGPARTTLADLVVGVREPSRGAVRRDGVDLRQLRPGARYRAVVRITPSDVVHGTIRENVDLGRPHVAEADVWAALDAVGLRRRVEALPHGLDTSVGPGALSEIERRALLVARAVGSPPSLLVVDGVLDGLPDGDRRRLLGVLAAPGARWTLLLLTSDLAVVHPDHRLLILGPGGLDERAPAIC